MIGAEHINAAVPLVKKWEGLRLTAYQDSVGVQTIGYGTTARIGVGIEPRFGMTITEREAETYLRRGLAKLAAEMAPGFKRKPTVGQGAAFLSLAYNLGTPTVIRSTALRRFNEGDDAGAAVALTWFNKAGGKTLQGLVNRRADERALFLSASAAPPSPAAPSGPLAALLRLLSTIFGKDKA